MSGSRFLIVEERAALPLHRQVHVSGINAYRSCPRRWYWTDEHMGLGFEPRERPDWIVLGSLVHRALELYYLTGTPLSDALDIAVGEDWDRYGPSMLEEEKQNHSRLCLVAKRLLSNYHSWLARSGADDDLDFIHTEVTFHIPLEEYDIVVAGTWDGLVVRRSTGGLYIMEHKTTRNVPRAVHGITWDVQPYIYAWAAEKVFDRPVHGVIYNIISTADPYDIPLLRNGMPSRAVRSTVQTTLQAYRETIIRCAGELGIPEESALELYAAELEYLSQAGDSMFFHREEMLVSKRVVESTFHQFVTEAHNMLETARRARDGVLPMPYKDRYKCPNCPARDACLAADEGADYMEILESTMKRRNGEGECTSVESLRMRLPLL